MPSRSLLAAACLVSAGLVGPPAPPASGVRGAAPSAQHAETVRLEPSKDNTLFEHQAGAKSNGRGERLFTGRSNHGARRRALLAFDIAAAVPAGATVLSVTLTLNLSREHSGPQHVSLHRLLADWGEGTSDARENEGGGAEATPGDATWLHRFFGTDRVWQSPGGDFADRASATLTLAAVGRYTWGPTPEMVADVQGWLDDPQSSYGWLVLGNEAATRTSKRFDSRDHADPDVRPVLEVAFAPPESGSFLVYMPTLLDDPP